MQRSAVLATEGPLLILAGAGSGKTTVLINRIANLIKFGRGSDCDLIPEFADERHLDIIRKGGEEADRLCAVEPVEPWRILAITFTNKAAGELKERLSKMLGDSADDIWACTFHSACVRILRRDAEKLGFPSSFTIYDTSDSLSLLKHIIKDFELDEKVFPPKAVLAEISRAKDASQGAADFLNDARKSGDIRRRKVGEIYVEYMRRMFAAGAMDFDDLIYNTVLLLTDNEDVRSYWQRRFRYVLIDEYQDTNHLQYLLAALLAEGYGNICVVGDDDQSIYKFRGATIENILSFENQFKNARTVRLEQNYRSTAHILDAANAVIRNNCGRKGKELWTNGETGEPVRLYVADNENDEAQYVASTVIGLFSQGGNWKDNAVLYRMNAQSNQLEYAFKRHGIPYRIVGGTRFFDRAEVKDVLAYLCVIETPADDLRLTRIINNPPRGIGDRSVETAQELADNNNCSLFEIINNADKYPELSRPALRMRQFANTIKELKEYSKEHTPDELLDQLLSATGYLRMLEEKNTVEDTARAENVREIKTSIITYMKESGDQTLSGFLADVALYTDMDTYDKDADCVVMMTMHSAKGLEFPNVFIVGMEEGIFPSLRVIGEEDEMEEERRLCYVAITRAMRHLYMVCARQRMLFGRTTANKTSRFVDEIPEEHIQKALGKSYGYRQASVSAVRSTDEFARKSYPQPRNGYSGTQSSANRTYSASPVIRPAAYAPKQPEPVDYSVGDKVRHKAFGSGVIGKMTPMGGDYLVEINFASVGIKKLMMKAAKLYLTKE